MFYNGGNGAARTANGSCAENTQNTEVFFNMAKTELNFRGMACPMPIMKTAMAFKKAASGDVFEITCDDPGFEPDIRAWSSETSNILNCIDKQGKDIKATITKK